MKPSTIRKAGRAIVFAAVGGAILAALGGAAAAFLYLSGVIL